MDKKRWGRLSTEEGPVNHAFSDWSVGVQEKKTGKDWIVEATEERGITRVVRGGGEEEVNKEIREKVTAFALRQLKRVRRPFSRIA